MKHVYYGIKQVSSPIIDFYEIGRIESRIRQDLCYHPSFRDLYKNEIESTIFRLQNGYDTQYVMKRYIHKDDVVIAEKNHDHVCEIKDNIKINDYEGVVKNRKYDAENDTMYYYTNIVVENVDTEETNKQLQSARNKIIEELQRICEHYFPEKKKDVDEKPKEKKKGFWSRLFGL